MKFSPIFLTIASVATAMAAALPEPEVEIPGKLVSRDEFELAIHGSHELILDLGKI
ncbi:hypothetical protein FPRO06_08862 [Fusarium proliferatum]|nr:hypothetical protein FPRO06_08862 [Fusarium proliferatum]